MRIVASPGVVELVRTHGGRLFVWTDPRRCCSGGVTYLATGPEPKGGREFGRFDAAGFELWFSSGNASPPDELHLAVKGLRKKRVEAYWNGCVYAI